VKAWRRRRIPILFSKKVFRKNMFHVDRLALQQHHLAKLIQGDTIRLKHTQLTGPITIHLTKLQWNKLRKVRANGKGMSLKMSTAQVRHNMQHGGGLWDTLKDIYHKVAPVITAVAPVVKAGYDIAKTGYDAYKMFGGDIIVRGGSPSGPRPIVARTRLEHDMLTGYGVDVMPWSDSAPSSNKLAKALRETLKQLPPTAAVMSSPLSDNNPSIGFQLTGTGVARRKRV